MKSSRCDGACVTQGAKIIFTLSVIVLLSLTSTFAQDAITTPRNRDASKSHGKLLTRASSGMPVSLAIANDDDSVALASFWNSIDKTVKADNVGHFGGHFERVSPEAVAELSGFVSGRSKYTLPKWWRDCLTTADLKGPTVWSRSAAYFAVPKGVQLSAAEDNAVQYLDPNGQAGLIGTAAQQRFRERNIRRLKAVICDESIVVFGQASVPESSPVVCCDRKTGSEAWISESWALGAEQLGGMSGVWEHVSDIEVDQQRKRLWIIGAGTGGVYLERYQVQTGQVELRFASNFWDYSRDAESSVKK
jgi:hypothetical protein